MASLRGLEPPTSWFVATRSIQLSYRLSSWILARTGGSPGLTIWSLAIWFEARRSIQLS